MVVDDVFERGIEFWFYGIIGYIGIIFFYYRGIIVLVIIRFM